MERKNKIRIIGIFVVALLWLSLSLAAWFNPSTDISSSERRPLAQFPKASAETILSGEFVADFEEYTVDQFPVRDTFRQIKSIFHYYIIQQKDNNDIYVKDGYAAKIEYPLNEQSLKYANECFDKIYQKYLKESEANIYMTVIPDKNYYIGNINGYLTMNYSLLFDNIKTNNPWATHIDISHCLSIDDYYKTDTHWKQENIIDVAQNLCNAMNVIPPNEKNFSIEKVNKPFYGVYYGQAALPMNPDAIHILTNKSLGNCIVTDFETGKTSGIYNKEMLNSKDLYDIYLSGAKALLSIENPNALTNKELIIFRDSFGSSITPLLLQSYSKITLIDIRYISINYIDKFVKFDNQDVLFLYSTLVLNSSFSFK